MERMTKSENIKIIVFFSSCIPIVLVSTLLYKFEVFSQGTPYRMLLYNLQMQTVKRMQTEPVAHALRNTPER